MWMELQTYLSDENYQITDKIKGKELVNNIEVIGVRFCTPDDPSNLPSFDIRFYTDKHRQRREIAHMCMDFEDMEQLALMFTEAVKKYKEWNP